MNTQLKAGLALSALFLIGFFSGWMFYHLTGTAPDTTQSTDQNHAQSTSQPFGADNEPIDGYPQWQAPADQENKPPRGDRPQAGERPQVGIRPQVGNRPHVGDRPQLNNRPLRDDRPPREQFDQPGANDNRRSVLMRIMRAMDLQSAEERQQFQEMLIRYRADLGDYLRENRASEMAEIQKRYNALQVELSEILSEEQLQKLDRFIRPENHRRALQDGRRLGSPQSRRPLDNNTPENR